LENKEDEEERKAEMEKLKDEGPPRPSSMSTPNDSNEEWKMKSALRPVKNLSLKMLPDKAPSRDELVV